MKLLNKIKDFFKSNKSIYTVTCMESEDNSRGKTKNLSTRCMGYYHNLNEAIKAVETDRAGISEGGMFDYCVIEEFKEGVYVTAIREIWFQYKDINIYNIDEDTTYAWVRIPHKPAEYTKGGTITNFGIG